MQGLCSISAHFWALEKARGRQPILILFPLLGTPENIGVMWHFCPLVRPHKGRGEATKSNLFYSMASHSTALHPNDCIPHGIRVIDEEEASVR